MIGAERPTLDQLTAFDLGQLGEWEEIERHVARCADLLQPARHDSGR